MYIISNNEFTPLSGGEGGAKTTRNEEEMSDGRGGCKTKLFLLTFLVSCVLNLASFGSTRSYPLTNITPTNCTGTDCSIQLPRIKNADYFTYRTDPTYRQTYSMLRLGTYFERRDVGMGSHQGVDIATKTGTPVYASYDGEVIVAERRGDRGNVIVIKHQRNGQTLYTTYAHLSSIEIKVWQTVKEGEKIGEVGETGNATGPHLHFQIEKNQDDNHPFFPKGCQGTIDEIVNEGNCFAKVREATLDPIVFLETTVNLTNNNNENKPSGSIYLNAKEIVVSGFVGGFMETESMKTLTLNKKESWGIFLTEPIIITGNASLLSFSPDKIQVLEGERNIFLQSKSMTGLALIKLQYGKQTLSYFPILINTPEGIEAWRQNKKLIEALKLLGMNG